MDIALRVMAGLPAVAFLASGAMKLARPGQKLAASGMGWAAGFTAGTVTGIGALEVLAAAGPILPAAVGIAPVLAPPAAAGLVLLMAGAFITHVRRHQARGMVVAPALAALVARGRFGPRPCTG
jgi:DoxX-like family